MMSSSISDPCNINNGGCDQMCRNNNGSPSCHCEPGFELMNDTKSCTGIGAISTYHRFMSRVYVEFCRSIVIEMNRPTELTVEWFHTLPDDVKRKKRGRYGSRRNPID